MSQAGKIIECKAAVAWEANKPLSIETIQVEPPRKGEVRIKILNTSVCHTDAYTLAGDDPEGVFPVVLGHEGAGVVESVGEEVTEFKPGDHVVPLYIPQCRECKFCLSPKTNLCQKIRLTQGKGLMPDGSVRFYCKGKQVMHFMGCSTFSQYTVVASISLCKIADAADLSTACLLGCGVSTGYGAAINTAKVEAGCKVAVWGMGAVGLAVVMGCKKMGAKEIWAIDTNPNKADIARKFGATHVVNPSDHQEPLDQLMVKWTDGGLDYTFDCTGNVQVMRTALESCHKGWGMSVVIGVAKSGEEISTRPFMLVTGRKWTGSAFGGWKSKDSVPRLVEAEMQGTLDVASFITHRFSLDYINQAFHVMHSGQSLRSVVAME